MTYATDKETLGFVPEYQRIAEIYLGGTAARPRDGCARSAC